MMIFTRLYSYIKSSILKIEIWFLTRVPRWRPILATLFFLILIESAILYGGSKIFAASFTFVQTDWSGGANLSSASHPGNQTGWSNFSAQASTDTSTAGTVKSASYSSSFTENFTATTYEDTDNTTVNWNTTDHQLAVRVNALVTTTIKGIDGSDVTTNPIDTTGTNLLIAAVGFDKQFGSSGTFTDSKGNTWTALTARAGPTYLTLQMYYVINPIVGSNHTFSFSKNLGRPWISVQAWTTDGIPAFVSENGNTASGSTSISTGSLSVGSSNLVVAGEFNGTAAKTITGVNNGFTLNNTGSLTFYTLGDAYLLTSGAGSVNPTFTLNGIDNEMAAGIANFSLTATGTANAQSLKVNTGSDVVKTVTLTKSDTPGTGSVSYFASNDGGASFEEVTPGTPHEFSTTGNGDLRWKASLSGNATVSSITLNYSGYATTATLTSSPYNSQDPGNIVAKVAWTASGETDSEIAKLQVRTSSDGATWSGWCGFEDSSSCDGSNYFESGDNNVQIPSDNPLRQGGDDQWFEYRVTLLSGGSATASFNDITITYVVNVAPEFNPTDGLIVSQVNDSSDPNYNKVAITYSIRDSDTDTATNTPGFVTPSFEYNVGSGWFSIPANYLDSNATDDKAVETVNYIGYTAYWDAKAEIPESFLATAQIRMTLNDNEAANNTAQATSSNFTLDTKDPELTTFTIDAGASTISLTAADDSNLEYRLSNNSDLSPDDANSTSGEWQAAGGNSIDITPAWNFADIPNHPTVYLQVRDPYGNTVSQTVVGPNASSNIQIQDISNPTSDNWALFCAWDPYLSLTGANFDRYEVFRSTDGESYSLAGTVTDVPNNYFADFNLTQGERYYYKVRVVDEEGDASSFSPVISKIVDGHGVDNSPPHISDVTVADTQSTSATITWTTDALSDSRVDFSVSPDTSFDTGLAVGTFLTSHTITLKDLTPNTNYLFQVKSANPAGATATDNNDGEGFSFATTSGPKITNVTETSINGTSAGIVWNTDIDSDSHVIYSSNADLSDSTTLGSSSLVGGSNPFQHSVHINGLTAGATYYFYVESQDSLGNNSKDNNGGQFYQFVTVTDNKPPTISELTVPVIAPRAAAVFWTTDEPATTLLDYGIASGNYNHSSSLDDNLVTFHLVPLTDLSEATAYFIRAHSRDDAGNQADSGEVSFTTGKTTVVNVNHGGGAGSASDDTTPPVISAIVTNNVTAFGATIEFKTNEPAIGLANYSSAENLGQSSGAAEFTTSHSIALAGLRFGTKYSYRVTATDKSGNTAKSELLFFTTKFLSEGSINVGDAYQYQKELESAIESALPSLVPPFVEKPQVTDITDTSAKVKWRTNIKSYGAVAYVEDSSYDSSKENSYTSEAADTTNKVIDHSIDLLNLKPNTSYDIMVKSFSLPQVVGRSPNLQFITEALKIQANVSNITNNSFKATWVTAESTTSVVEYRNLKTGELNQKASDVKTKSHDILIDNLTPGTQYSVNIFGYNDRGNKISIASSIKITTSVDVVPPVITSLTIDSALIPGRTDHTQTIVSWRTDEPSTSTVFYKEGTALPDEKLNNKVEILNSFVIDHAVVVSSLKSGGLYSIQVASTDAAGNQALFPIRTAVIPAQSQSVIEIIFKNFEDTFKFLK